MQPVYENLKNKTETGIQYVFYTFSDSYEPLHWHEELEILYYLNGSPDITVDGKTMLLPSRRTFVINDSISAEKRHLKIPTGMSVPAIAFRILSPTWKPITGNLFLWMMFPATWD